MTKNSAATSLAGIGNMPIVWANYRAIHPRWPSYDSRRSSELETYRCDRPPAKWARELVYLTQAAFARALGPTSTRRQARDRRKTDPVG